MLDTAIFIVDEKAGVRVRSERRRRTVRVKDSGPFFRRGPGVTTVPRKRVHHGCDDLAVGLARPDDRFDSASSNVGDAEIKRVHRARAADDRVGVTVHVEIKHVVVVGNEGHGETNITDFPIAVIDLLGVGGPDLKHVARSVGAVGAQPGAVFRQISQDAPQENVLRSVGTVDKTNLVTNSRDGDAGRA